MINASQLNKCVCVRVCVCMPTHRVVGYTGPKWCVCACACACVCVCVCMHTQRGLWHCRPQVCVGVCVCGCVCLCMTTHRGVRYTGPKWCVCVCRAHGLFHMPLLGQSLRI